MKIILEHVFGSEGIIRELFIRRLYKDNQNRWAEDLMKLSVVCWIATTKEMWKWDNTFSRLPGSKPAACGVAEGIAATHHHHYQATPKRCLHKLLKLYFSLPFAAKNDWHNTLISIGMAFKICSSWHCARIYEWIGTSIVLLFVRYLKKWNRMKWT